MGWFVQYVAWVAVVAALMGCGADTSERIDYQGGRDPVGCEDADGDGIIDSEEGDGDPDHDGKPNRLDTDSDGDGIADDAERVTPICSAAIDSDSDGTPDYLDLDSDNDGVLDAPDAMGGLDTDHDGTPDSRDADDDGDFITDVIEIGDDPSMPRDSDGDGVPDYLDTDSDADGILDQLSGAGDLDNDGVPDYLDDDTDGDGLADVHEIGDDPSGPRDSDDDGTPDYLDPDSDGDGLADGLEDTNDNGMLDPGESSPLHADTDGDGADDLVEQAAMTDPNDAANNPQADGNFVFVVPYQAAPTPKDATLDFATTIQRADIVFSMDTTGSMGGALETLKAALSTQIVPELNDQIPDLGFAITSYEDMPVGSFGAPGGVGFAGDLPFEIASPVTTDVADAQAALNTLTLGSGGDTPESGIEALYQIATGAGVSWPADASIGAPAGSIPPFDMGYRPGALPIVIQISDAENQSAATYGAFVPEAASRQDAFDALAAIQAKVILVNVAQSSIALADHLEIVETTGAVVPPSAFGPSGQCLTGINGAQQPPNANGQCPLLYNVDFNGAGLGGSIVDAVQALAGSSTFDIDARPVNEASNSGGVDAVAAFIDHVTPNDMPASSTGCKSGVAVDDRLGNDGVDDTFVGVTGGVRVCFDVVPKMNTTVMPADEPQLFRARIDVYGDNVTVLDDREVWFVVPPKPPVPGGVCAKLDGC